MQNYSEYQGELNVQDKKIAIVTARFNEVITSNLTKGALNALEKNGVQNDNIKTITVPGAFELPFACLKLAEENYDGIIALGCVIKGDTPHFDYVCAETTRGIGEIILKTKTPIGFGLLTTDNFKQAEVRSTLEGENKGYESAMALLEMVTLFHN